MSSTFPILRLPFLPLSNVLNTVKLNELFKISLCSKKSLKIAKQVRNKSIKVAISFSSGKCARILIGKCFELISVSDNSELPKGQHEQLKIGDMIVPVTRGVDDSLNTYWNDQFVGITKLLDFVTDFFGSPIYELNLSAEKHPEDPRIITDWVTNRQESIANIYFECKNTSDEEFKYFLDTCKITNNLYLYVKTSEKFQHSINFELEDFHIGHGHWLTLANLFSLNCEFMEIDGARFTSIDVNMFLNHWKNGGNSRLRGLGIRMDNPNIIEVTAGLEVTQRFHAVKRVYAYQKPVKKDFHWSYDIQRNDGVMGSIIHYSNGIQFVVWPDWDGQPY